MKYRLKCDCFTGDYSKEYIISYKGPKKLNWSFVPVKDVIRKEYTGLVKVVLLDENSDTCLVEMNNLTEPKGKSRFLASKRDIVKGE